MCLSPESKHCWSTGLHLHGWLDQILAFWDKRHETRGMLQLKQLSWWSLYRDKKQVKEQRLACTHLKTPGNRSKSVERFRKDDFGAQRNPGIYRWVCEDWGRTRSKRKQWTGVKLLPWDTSETSLNVHVWVYQAQLPSISRWGGIT